MKDYEYYKSYFSGQSIDIENNLTLSQYKNAANNCRSVVEVICDYYVEEFKLKVEPDKNGSITLSCKEKAIKKSNKLSETDNKNLKEIRIIGNNASHGKEISEEDAKNIYELLKTEMNAVLTSISEKTLTLNADSIEGEGWICSGKNVAPLQREGKRVIQNFTVVHGIPSFLDTFYKSEKLFRMDITLEKRIIDETFNEYYGTTGYYYDSSNEKRSLNVWFKKDSDSNNIDEFQVTTQEENETVLYRYNRYQREKAGTWHEYYNISLNLLQKMGYEFGDSLYNLSEPERMLSILGYHKPYTPFRFDRKWVLVDEDSHYAVVSRQSIDVVGFDNEQFDRNQIQIRANINIDVEKGASKLLFAKAEDFYRLHLLRNAFLFLLEKKNLIDDSFDSSAIFVRDSEICCTLLDFELGIDRNQDDCVLRVYDPVRNEKHDFTIKNTITIDDVEKDNRVFGSLGFTSKEIGVDYNGVISCLNPGGFVNSIEQTIDDEKYINSIVSALIIPSVWDKHQEMVKKLDAEIAKKKKQEEMERLAEEQRKIEAERKAKEIERKAREAEQKAKEEEIRKVRNAELKKKGKKYGIITAVIVTACVLAVSIPCIAYKLISGINSIIPHYIDLNDYVTVEASGYDGLGTINIKLDDSYGKNYKEKIKYKSNKSKSDAYKDILTYCHKSVENDGILKNGDKVVVKWTIDNDSINNQFNYRIRANDIEYTVSGLKEIEMFDPFENFSYRVDGISQDGELVIVSNLNSMEYYGLKYEADKYENINNGDIIHIRVLTENGSDLNDYCEERFNKIPKRNTYEIEISGMPEYVMDYSDLTDDFINEAKKVCLAKMDETYDYEDPQTREQEYTTEYLGNYFFVEKTYGRGNCRNCITLVYKVNAHITPYFGAEYDYSYYTFSEIMNIYTDNGEIEFNMNDVWVTEESFTRGWNSVRFYGYQEYGDIYSEYIQPLEGAFYVQNNMNE